MSHGAFIRRGRVALLTAAVVVLALLVPAVALAASTPSVTIVGPGLQTTPTPTASPTAAAPVVHSQSVSLYLQDNDWGADQVRFSNDGVTWSSPQAWDAYAYWYLWQDVDVTLRLDGQHTVTAQFSKDGGATWEASATATTLLDTQAPVIEAPGGYWNNHHPYRLQAHDQIGLAGVQSLWYRVDAGALQQVTTQEPLGSSAPLTASFALAGTTGTAHSIDFLARDYAGNYSSRAVDAGARVLRSNAISVLPTSTYVVIDRTPPTVKARGWAGAWQKGPVIISLSAKDAKAGVERIEYSVTGVRARQHAAWTSGTSVAVTQSGRHKVWFRAIDRALPSGNASAPRCVIVNVL